MMHHQDAKTVQAMRYMLVKSEHYQVLDESYNAKMHQTKLNQTTSASATSALNTKTIGIRKKTYHYQENTKTNRGLTSAPPSH